MGARERCPKNSLSDKDFPASLIEIASKFDWSLRLMNPAVNYLVNRSICRDTEVCGTHPWAQPYVQKKQNGSIRRFVNSRS